MKRERNKNPKFSAQITQQVELLEKKALLTITTNFGAVTGALGVSSDGVDAITIDTNVFDEVTINSVVLEDDGSPVASADVISVVVNGGAGNDFASGQGGLDTVAGNASNDSIGDAAFEIDEGFTFFCSWVDSI